MHKLFNDFETQSAVNIDIGSYKYSLDSSTRPLMWAYAIDDAPVRIWIPGQPFPIRNIEQLEIHAHNAAFEYDIWKNVMVPRYGWPDVQLSQFHCTAARCAAMGLPRALEKAAKAINLPILKDESGKHKMQQITKPRKPSKNDPNVWNYKPGDFAQVVKYCMNDVEVERALHHATDELTETEKLAYYESEWINSQGIPIDEQLILRMVAAEEYSKKMAVKEMTAITERLRLPIKEQITSVDQRNRILKFCNDRGANLLDCQAPTIQARLDQGGLDPDVEALLRARQKANKASVKKCYAALKRGVRDEQGTIRVHGAHLFLGAGPGRWAARGIQIQNYARGLSGKPKDQAAAEQIITEFHTTSPQQFHERKIDVASNIKKVVRRTVKAPTGSLFGIIDFAQIEARVAAWFVDDNELLNLFRRGEDPYIGLASKIYGYPVTIDMDERTLGKAARLGLQYQMGAKKFVVTAKQQYGLDISLDMAQKAVEAFRTESYKIKEMWDRLKYASIDCVENERTRVINEKSRFTLEKNWLRLSLPTRKISYCHPHIQFIDAPPDWNTDKKVQTLFYWGEDDNHRWVPIKTYGGKLFENIVQGIARDILRDGMRRLLHEGYKIVAHIHDEVIIEMLIDSNVVNRFNRACDLLRVPPSWAPNIPIEVEGFLEERYRK